MTTWSKSWWDSVRWGINFVTAIVPDTFVPVLAANRAVKYVEPDVWYKTGGTTITHDPSDDAPPSARGVIFSPRPPSPPSSPPSPPLSPKSWRKGPRKGPGAEQVSSWPGGDAAIDAAVLTSGGESIAAITAARVGDGGGGDGMGGGGDLESGAALPSGALLASIGGIGLVMGTLLMVTLRLGRGRAGVRRREQVRPLSK